jgi:hypothetical protein
VDAFSGARKPAPSSVDLLETEFLLEPLSTLIRDAAPLKTATCMNRDQ